ncbi:MAG: hypothetical protein MUF51_04320 [Vicinamibacteria bacterium]|jgi:tetratricopeptide (TPR) repeat protein|nr:hypothetical protein [Vicinamibacteria bacterium]
MMLLMLNVLLTLGSQAAPVPAGAPAESPALATTPVSAPSAESVAVPVPALIASGLKAYRLRHWARAEADFLKALAEEPKSAAAAYYLGYTIYKRVEHRPFHADKQKAAQYFAQAFASDPTFRPDWGKK